MKDNRILHPILQKLLLKVNWRDILDYHGRFLAIIDKIIFVFFFKVLGPNWYCLENLFVLELSEIGITSLKYCLVAYCKNRKPVLGKTSDSRSFMCCVRKG